MKKAPKNAIWTNARCVADKSKIRWKELTKISFITVINPQIKKRDIKLTIVIAMRCFCVITDLFFANKDNEILWGVQF